MIMAHGGFMDDSGLFQHACVWKRPDEALEKKQAGDPTAETSTFIAIDDSDDHYGYSVEHQGSDVIVRSNLQRMIDRGFAEAGNFRLTRTHISGMCVGYSGMPEHSKWLYRGIFIAAGPWKCDGYVVLTSPEGSTRIVNLGFPTQTWGSAKCIIGDPLVDAKIEIFVQGKDSEVARQGDQLLSSRSSPSDSPVPIQAWLASATSEPPLDSPVPAARPKLFSQRELASRPPSNDMTGNMGWAAHLETLHERQPVLSLKEALLPTFHLFRSKYPDEYRGWTDDTFNLIIDSSIAEMTTRLAELNIADEYEVEMAAGINIFTKEFPPWYWLMSEAFNDAQARGHGKGGPSSDVAACLPYSKFLKNALLNLPSQFHHKGTCLRGVNWVYPTPLDHDPEKHFPTGREVVMFSWKSATTDVGMVQSQEQFCGRYGIRTMFKMELGSIAYKISDFSDFPSESEVLLPILSRFIVKTVLKLITVKLHGEETEASVCELAFKKSSDHAGDPDIVVLEPAKKT